MCMWVIFLMLKNRHEDEDEDEDEDAMPMIEKREGGRGENHWLAGLLICPSIHPSIHLH